MPGPVSDSYDCEWGTGENRDRLDTELGYVYKKVTDILGGRPPIYILEMLRRAPLDFTATMQGNLTEKEWRLIRFALERARDSI